MLRVLIVAAALGLVACHKDEPPPPPKPPSDVPLAAPATPVTKEPLKPR
jgi:hypothetical protein